MALIPNRIQTIFVASHWQADACKSLLMQPLSASCQIDCAEANEWLV
jgi:hypothetical protein